MTVVVDGCPVRLSSRRQEQLLALLVCARGRAVSAERLIDALWGELPDPRSGKNLHVLVHRLRRTLKDAARIRHDRSGYALVARTPEVDAWHFADLVGHARQALGRGDAKLASISFGEALALWNGPAFTGLDDVLPLAVAAERLEQDRRQALSGRVEADLALGRHSEVVHELVAMVEEDPLAEPVVAQLMVALHRSGRRVDALEAYQRTRAALTEELGLEPGPKLRALHEAVLRGDGEIGLPPGVQTAAMPEAASIPRALVPFLRWIGTARGESHGEARLGWHDPFS